MTHFFLKKLSIPRRSFCCAKTEERFSPDAEYISLIREGEEGELYREDISLTWWTKHGQEDLLKEVKSFWRGRVPSSSSRPEEPQEFYDKALYLLRHCLSEDNQESDLKAFILALFLARKKF